jgi:hypothetical protein
MPADMVAKYRQQFAMICGDPAADNDHLRIITVDQVADD